MPPSPYPGARLPLLWPGPSQEASPGGTLASGWWLEPVPGEGGAGPLATLPSTAPSSPGSTRSTTGLPRGLAATPSSPRAPPSPLSPLYLLLPPPQTSGVSSWGRRPNLTWSFHREGRGPVRLGPPNPG